MDVNRCHFAGAANYKFQTFGVVDCWISVWACDHRGDAAGCRRLACGAKTFFVPFARFANLDPDIDDPGGEVFAAAVDDQLGTVRVGAVTVDDF